MYYLLIYFCNINIINDKINIINAKIVNLLTKFKYGIII